jgi:hypothetical protein
MIISAALTVALLPLVSVMAWRCWNLPPIPATRIWSLSFGVMTLAMLLQAWRADLWKLRFERLARSEQPRRSQSQQFRQFLPSSNLAFQRPTSVRQAASLVHAGSCYGDAGFRLEVLQFAYSGARQLRLRMSDEEDDHRTTCNTRLEIQAITHQAYQARFPAFFGDISQARQSAWPQATKLEVSVKTILKRQQHQSTDVGPAWSSKPNTISLAICRMNSPRR